MNETISWWTESRTSGQCSEPSHTEIIDIKQLLMLLNNQLEGHSVEHTAPTKTKQLQHSDTD